MARKYFLVIILVINRLAVLAQNPDTSFNYNIRLLNKLYQTLSAHYVDPLNKDTVMKNTVNGMLRRLDPWTYFLSKEAAKEQKERMTNKFGGVGMAIRVVDNEIVISKVIKGFPADKGGVMVADVLVSVNSKSVKGLSTDAVSNMLRGDPGTNVTIVYNRPGTTATISSVLTREIISPTTVPFYGMLDDHTGYIFTTAMTTGVSQEVKAALLDLKTRPEFKRLILDLRDNWGGYVQEAFDIASLFLKKGVMTARIMGRTTDKTHMTRYDPVDLDIPLVVLIGKNTASAAEILAGILQDYDRAVLIGERTYGKAMVQEVYDLGDGNQANMTVAHYYTPSGRCIQVKSYKDAYGKIIEDSIHKIFKTKNGRTVKSNNAIEPDIKIALRVLPILAVAANNQNHFFKYAAKYRSTHPQIPTAATFKLTDIEFNAFYESLVNANYPAKTESDYILEEWKQETIKNGDWKDLESAYMLFKNSIENWKKKDLEANKESVKNWIEREISSMYYGEAGFIEAAIKDDAITLKAREVIRDPVLYNSLLQVR